MGPIASKLLQEIRKGKHLRAVRELKGPASSEPELRGIPVQHRAWIATFRRLALFSNALLDADALRKTAQQLRAAEEDYAPGGPPMSPILDSVFMSWSLADLPIGPQRETLCSIVSEIGPALGIDLPLIAAARALASSRMGVYRVREIGAHRVELTDICTAQCVEAEVPNDMRQRGPYWLTRLLPPLSAPTGDWVVWTTPYQLDGPSIAESWRSYTQRVLEGTPEAQRQQRLEAHFKSLDAPRRWLEYIFYAYAGVTQIGAIVLQGIEDMPQTLPQHSSFDHVAARDPGGDAAPLERVRLRLEQIADQHGFVHEHIAESERQVLLEAACIMERTHRLYGQLDVSGRSALDILATDRTALSEPEREAVEELLDGWFSVFEVRRVKVDEGLQARDILLKRDLWITEKAATRQLQLGDLLFGWLTVKGDLTRLEGGLGHVPANLAKPFIASIRRRRSTIARKHPNLDWKKQHGLLALPAMELLARLYADAPVPQLVNAAGEEVVFSEARYSVSDRARVAKILGTTFEAHAPGTYVWLDGSSLAGKLELKERELWVQCDSRERLQTLKIRLNELLGDTLTHRADAYEDPTVSVQRARKSGERPAPRGPAPELPKEVAAQLQAMMLARMRDWLDEPIPMLGGKTPRQAARTERGRDDVTLMLIHQQQLFDRGPGLPKIDLTEIWHSLGLTPRS